MSNSFPEAYLDSPLRLIISYRIENINHRKIESYELDMLLKAGETQGTMMPFVKEQLKGFNEEVVGIVEILYQDAKKKKKFP